MVNAPDTRSTVTSASAGTGKLTSAVRNNRCYTVAKGSLSALPPKIRSYVEEKAALCQPDAVYICDGSEQENKDMIATLRTAGVFEPLPKYENCWLAGTDPSDVARVESKTFIVTSDKRETTPTPVEGVEGQLNIWKSPAEYENEFNSRFPGCMKGRTMYVLPFSMGPVGSPLSKIGIQLTDSPYVVTSTRIMTRMGADVLKVVDENTFIKALHSVGCPLPLKEKLVNNWPCNPKQVMVAHIPDNNEIASFGSGYGGNSLLGKKCFALRLGSILAHREGWLAEHMLILGITNPEGHKRYIAAAFPSQCGKTNLAMMQPSLPGYKIECVGDDIAWMRFDKEGRLRAINPEAGFFGVAPGTSMKTNPQAMMTIKKNTVFTNVAKTSDGGVYWEDIDEDAVTPGATITSWTGKENWSKADGKPAAHPNSRFCTPAGQCPIIDPAWEDSAGVPIDAIIFGGRRPQGVPLVYESYNWQHGVFVGASMRSESTSAAEHKGKMIMHDPFAMRPFFGYNFGDYIKHWLSFAEQKPALQLPKVFHVNWFRKNAQKKFVWPGFGENVRVLDWVIKRVENQDVADKSAIGYVPKAGTLNTEGLTDVDTSELFALDRDFLLQESEEIGKYFREQVNSDLPEEMWVELENLRKRASDM